MKKALSLLLAVLLAMTTFATFSAFAADDDLVPDAGLAAAIRHQLKLADDATITKANLESLKNLDTTLEYSVGSLEGLQYATNLESLGMSYGDGENDNTFSDLTPLKDLKKLRILWLDGCEAKDLTPLSGLTNLTELKMSDTNVSDLTPIAGLTNLKKVQFDNCNISDISALKDMTQLESVSFILNSIDKIDALAGKTELYFIAFTYNRLTSIQPLKGLKKIEGLRVDHNYIDFENADEKAVLEEIKSNSTFDPENSLLEHQTPASEMPTTTEPTTEKPTQLIPAKTLLIDDFNRDKLDGFVLGKDIIEAISSRHTTLMGPDGNAATTADVDNYIDIKSTPDDAKPAMYVTQAVLGKGETHKYLVLKIKGTKGGEEFSLTSNYDELSEERKAFSEYVGPDGKPVPALTTEWQYIIIDIDKSGMTYDVIDEDKDVIFSSRSFWINFQFDKADAEVLIDEMYFADSLEPEQPTTAPTTEPTPAPTTEPTTAHIPDNTKLFDDFNRVLVDVWDPNKCILETVSPRHATILAPDGSVPTEANVDNYLHIISTPEDAKPAVYCTSVELGANESYKYIVFKIRGAKGGEEKLVSLTNEYEPTAEARKLLSEYKTPDGKPVALTTEWQYIAIDITKNGMVYDDNGDSGSRSFRLNFQFDKKDAEIFIDEIYFSDDNSLEPTPDQPTTAGDPDQPTTQPITAGDPDQPTTQPTTAGDPDQPTTQPTTSGNQDQPTTSGNQDQPTTSGNQDQPTTSGNQDQPTTSGNPDQPTTSGNQDQPTTSGNPDQPTTSGNQDQPTTSGNQDQPTTAGNPDQPNNGGNTNGGNTNGGNTNGGNTNGGSNVSGGSNSVGTSTGVNGVACAAAFAAIAVAGVVITTKKRK